MSYFHIFHFDDHAVFLSSASNYGVVLISTDGATV